MDRKTRGRASKVDLLPENVRKTLHEMLRDKAIPQARILEEINALIEDAGLPDEMKLSRSGLNRYATNVEQVGHNLRQMREMTSALTAELGDKPMGETTKLILEMARSQLFKAMMRQIENPESDVDIDLLKNAMLAAPRWNPRQCPATGARAERNPPSGIRRRKIITANAVSEELRGQDGIRRHTTIKQRIRDVLLGKA
ncbi:DUF3486 family protein [Escherichia coli]|nr:DUF3486 family protein [Escherichia coli]